MCVCVCVSIVPEQQISSKILQLGKQLSSVVVLGRQKVPGGEDILRIQLHLGGLVQSHPDAGHRLRVPPRADLPHAVVVRDGPTGREDFVPGVGLDRLVHVHRIGKVTVVEPEVEVHARARVVRLRHAARDEVVVDVVFGTFLREKKEGNIIRMT